MKSNRMLSCLSFLVLFSLDAFWLATLRAEDVTRFRGDNSQGKYNEAGLLDVWPEDGLKPKWLITDLGEGWGSVIKIKDRLYLSCLDTAGSKKESIVCLDLNGKKLWQQPVGGIWEASYPLPRATPTYVSGKKPADDRLLLLSGNGTLSCLAAKDGKPLWQKELAKMAETQFGNWGMAESVVAGDGRVFVTLCGKKGLAAALNLKDGSTIWVAEPIDDRCAYVTPVLYENQLIIMTAGNVLGLDTKTGKALWQNDFQKAIGEAGMRGINCNPPVLKGNRVFVSAGYNQGGVMYEILPGGKGVKVCWMSKVLDPHHDGAVEVDGRLYGSNWLNNGAGKWCCLDWDTGETVYEEAWEKLGKGVTIFADGKLFLYEEKRGTLGLAQPGDRFNVVSSFPIGFGTKEHWAHPVISDGVLYVRHGNALAAYDIKK